MPISKLRVVCRALKLLILWLSVNRVCYIRLRVILHQIGKVTNILIEAGVSHRSAFYD